MRSAPLFERGVGTGGATVSNKWVSRAISVLLFFVLAAAIVGFIVGEISGWVFWPTAFLVAAVEVEIEEKRKT